MVVAGDEVVDWSAVDGNDCSQTVCSQSKDNYFHPGESLDWWEMTVRGRLKAELLLGYTLCDGSLVLNPDCKSDKISSCEVKDIIAIVMG